MKINNRRYIGCKTKLLDFIYETVDEYGFSNGAVLADIFGGTGVVANKFANAGYKTIVNDTLYSNVLSYEAFLGSGELRYDALREYIEKYNLLEPSKIEDNYFSKVYGGKYFSNNDAKLIGCIRDDIEKNKKNLNSREYAYLITTLIYSCDKIANTVGHFESFLKKEPIDKGVMLSELEINENIHAADIYNEDANLLAKKIVSDITYIDPPYNARQYVNFYHVLENLARWNKPMEFEGNSMKFKRKELKSDYCRNKAPDLFKDLIESLQTKLIVVSYNNTYKAGSISSINTITQDQIIETLSQKGNVKIKEVEYKAFNSGKTELSGHKEYLYICEVSK